MNWRINMALAALLLSVLSPIFTRAQSADPTLRFETASVKPAPASRGTGSSSSPHGAPWTHAFTPIHLKVLIGFAYNVPVGRIVGPAWLDTDNYDVVAQARPGTSTEQYRTMLQNLIADRFGLQFHRETRPMPGYELTVRKSGHLAEASTDTSSYTRNIPPRGLLRVKGQDGQIELAPGRKGRITLLLSSGLTRFSGRLQSMADIAEMCQTELRTPVADRTGLPGNYDFNLDFQRRTGIAPSGSFPEEEAPPSNTPVPIHDGGPPDFIAAMQEQLGLKLGKAKVPVEVLVIDHAEKVPAGN